MFIKRSTSLFGALLFMLALILSPSISQAKFSSHSSYGGGFSSSFSHSYSKPSWGGSSSHSFSYSKPSWGGSSGMGSSSHMFSYSKPPSSSSSFGGYSKPSSGYASTGSSIGSSSTLYNRKHSWGISSNNYSAMNSYSRQYRQPPIIINHNYYSSPGYSHMYSTYGSADGYYSARQRDIGGWYSRYPEPSYVYGMHPNYGIYDSYFMWLLLANAMQPSYAGWAYAHQNDPSYQQWYADMQQQAATNSQVASQLATLNAQVAALNAAHATPMAQDALPTGVTPDVAISPAAVTQDPNLDAGTDPTAAAPSDPAPSGPGFFGWLVRIIVGAGVLFGIGWGVKTVFFPAPKNAVRW